MYGVGTSPGIDSWKSKSPSDDQEERTPQNTKCGFVIRYLSNTKRFVMASSPSQYLTGPVSRSGFQAYCGREG